MFGIGGWELLVIIAVALLVLGPKRLPAAARTLGKGVQQLRKATVDLRRSIELDPEMEDLPRSLDQIGRPIVPPGVINPRPQRRPLDQELGPDGTPPGRAVPVTGAVPAGGGGAAPDAGALEAAPAGAAPGAPGSGASDPPGAPAADAGAGPEAEPVGRRPPGEPTSGEGEPPSTAAESHEHGEKGP